MDMEGLDEFRSFIGKKVRKIADRTRSGKRRVDDGRHSSKPFKSGLKANTVKDVVEHPILGIPAFTFVEDDSCVECRRCRLAESDKDKVIIRKTWT